MDHTKLINLVKEFPQVWDRNCPLFRERDHKQVAWEKIGQHMDYPANICKDTYKSLREKYIREREKQSMFGDKYLPWLHLDSLSFLDPHIVLRKQQVNFDEEMKQKAEQLTSTTTTTTTNTSSSYNSQFDLTSNHTDFDRTLINMVRKATPIWDRKSNGYPSKQLKYQLWKTIAQSLNKDVNICMTRWKGLREKYIRQKSKYQEGEGKWEFLDDMCFLDTVIQYRRKHCETLENRYNSPNDFSITPTDNYHHNNSTMGDDSLNDSSSDFVVKSENIPFEASPHDNSYDSGMLSAGRKRSASDNSESSVEKRDKIEDSTAKTPEQVFGDLVATMLAKKTERDKNFAMIEIMKVLTK